MANPKSILTEATLDWLIAKSDSYENQFVIFQIVDLYNGIGDLDTLMTAMAKEATKPNGEKLTTDELADIYKAMIVAINPLVKVSNSLGMTASILFRSLSDVEEEMVGFYGSSVTADSVPVTAIGKAIAEDASMSARLMQRLRFNK